MFFIQLSLINSTNTNASNQITVFWRNKYSKNKFIIYPRFQSNEIDMAIYISFVIFPLIQCRTSQRAILSIYSACLCHKNITMFKAAFLHTCMCFSINVCDIIHFQAIFPDILTSKKCNTLFNIVFSSTFRCIAAIYLNRQFFKFLYWPSFWICYRLPKHLHKSGFSQGSLAY